VRYAFISSRFDSIANLVLGTDIANNEYYAGCDLDFLGESDRARTVGSNESSSSDTDADQPHCISG